MLICISLSQKKKLDTEAEERKKIALSLQGKKNHIHGLYKHLDVVEPLYYSFALLHIHSKVKNSIVLHNIAVE